VDAPPRDLTLSGASPPVGPERASADSPSGQGAVSRGRPRRCLLKGCEGWFSPTHQFSRYCSEACRQAADRWRRWKAAWAYRSTPEGRAKRREQARRYRERRRAEAERARGAPGDLQTPPRQEHGAGRDTSEAATQTPLGGPTNDPVTLRSSFGTRHQGGPPSPIRRDPPWRSAEGGGLGEGHRKAGFFEFLSCDRPGCYEVFSRSARSPLRCFCSSACRAALRRVELRERRHFGRHLPWTRARLRRQGERVTHIDVTPPRR